jgi:hypothetical protein
VNGAPKKIEILNPFEEAIEMTKKILFQPFVFEKWLVIAFAAFLVGHFGGGGGFRFPFNNFGSRHTNYPVLSPEWEQWKPWLTVGTVAFAIAVLVLIFVFTWLRSRGTFIFTDCIARNRAAIVEPWREFRHEGNSYFLFLLVVLLCWIGLIGLMLAPIWVCVYLFTNQNYFAGGGIVLLLFVVWLCFSFVFGLTSYFMIPLMYVRRCRAGDAFRQVVRLILDHPGPFILFALFSFCLLIAVAIIGGVATCATCCIAALPYVGTVILLPVFVCLRAFGLLFIRQFGADYDVWAAILQSSVPPAAEPPPLPSQ